MQKIRSYLDEKNREKAVTLAIRDCIREGIFADFVKEHGSEAEKMLFTRCNADEGLEVNDGENIVFDRRLSWKGK